MNTDRKSDHRRRSGFTLVELLVVIAIIGVLVALLLPAIQAAREAARRTQCKNQLRQLAISFHQHHDAHKFLPSGGWGFYWMGFPEQGYGKRQSGGWLYSVLPYMEENTLHDFGRGLSGTALRDAARKRAETPFEGMTCPSRRKANVYPFNNPLQQYRYCTMPLQLASKTDYAANAGSIRTPEIDNSGGPPELGADLLAVKPPDAIKSARGDLKENWNGIAFYCSEVGMRQITDGTSKTYMVGEKWMYVDNYESGLDDGDSEPALVGCNTDTLRVTNQYYPLAPDSAYSYDKIYNTDKVSHLTFGSAHEGGFNMAMCDGSVEFVELDIDPLVHHVRGARNDDDVPPKDATGGAFD